MCQLPPSRPTLTAWWPVDKALTSLCLSFPISEMGTVYSGAIGGVHEAKCVFLAPVVSWSVAAVAAGVAVVVVGVTPHPAPLLHCVGHSPWMETTISFFP